MTRGGRRSYAGRPDITPPAMVYDLRRPKRWGVLRQMGSRAGRVQFGPVYKTDCEWIRFEFLQAVPQAEIDAALEAERAKRQEAEDLV